MFRRRLFIVALDTAMLALVCILECLDLTGLEIHQWLGFVLCPLILIHVTLQWQWFKTQFQKLLTKGHSVTSKNVALNSHLLLLMSAVLISGLLTSRQIALLFGEYFGSVKLWREIHGWLNFTVVALVGLHLGLNLDWLMPMGWKVRPLQIETKARPHPNHTTQAPRVNPTRPTQVSAAELFRTSARGLGAVFAVLLSATLVYVVMGLLIVTPQPRTTAQSSYSLSSAPSLSPGPLIPAPRPIRLSHGIEQLFVTVGVLVLCVVLARYVLRLRL